MSIRVSEQDWLSIHKRAEQTGMTLTEFVTTSCLAKEIAVFPGLEETIRQQKYIGKNLNQLTTLANMGKIKAPNLEDLICAYSAMNDHLADLMKKRG